MAIDVGKAFEIGKDGLLIEGGVALLSGVDDPTTSPPASAPNGSLYLRTNGQQYRLAGGWNEESGGGVSAAQHLALDQLVHELAETSFTEVVRTSGKVSAVTTWESAAKIRKIRETIVTRTAGIVSQLQLKQYDNLGVLLNTLTTVVTRSAGKVSDLTDTYV